MNYPIYQLHAKLHESNGTINKDVRLKTMVKEGLKNGIYKETTDTTLHDLKLFQDFLYLNFKDYKDYEKMRPVSNHLALLYASAKTHKFDNINDAHLDQLKVRLVMDQTGTYTYNATI